MERCNTSVDRHVHLEPTPRGVGLLAEGAFEGLLSGVDSPVAFNGAGPREHLAAIRTAQFLLPGVGEHVVFQVSVVCEGLHATDRSPSASTLWQPTLPQFG